MSSRPVSVLRFVFPLLAILAPLAFAACDEDATAPEPVNESPVPIGVVLGSVDLSLTVFPVDTPTVTRTIGLGPAGTPVSLAVRRELAAVPLGTVPAVAIVDLAAATVLRTVGLEAGSGATGVAFANDSIVIVANPDLGTITPINARSGSGAASVSVGTYPQNVLVHESRIYVVNANLVNFSPAGPGSISVLDAGTYATLATIVLSGMNSSGIALGPDGLLYVVNSGNFGMADGSVSVVSTVSFQEVAHHPGFGDFPSAVTFGPDGTLYTTSFSYGVVAWNSGTRTFARTPDSAIEPGGVPSASGIGTDDDGRLYSLAATCTGPDQAHRLNNTYGVELSITVGICPTSIQFTELPAS